MRTGLRLPVTIVLAASLAVAAPLLGGCSLVSGVVSNATGGDVQLPSQSIPSDFPSEVPLIDGKVALGLGVGDGDAKGWNVSIEVSGADAYDTISQQLTDAGFVKQDVADTADATTGAFNKDDLVVLVVVAQSNDTWVANYTVSRNSTPAQ